MMNDGITTLLCGKIPTLAFNYNAKVAHSYVVIPSFIIPCFTTFYHWNPTSLINNF